MLFPYKFINHEIARLQHWIDYLFMHVWCNAKDEYSFDLLSGCPDLKKVAEEEAWKEDENKREIDYITGPISVIYDLFKDELSASQRKVLKKWYKRNRNVEKICSNEKLYKPLSRAVMKSYSSKLDDALYKFYVNLFEHVLDLATISNKNGTLKNHYDSFISINSNGTCPFCGILPMRSYEMEGHEAYDHYLPKETYPFLAVNFKNLVPTCHTCNSIHKSRQIPVYKKHKNTLIKRKAFYPYSLKEFDVNISIKVNIKDYKLYEHKHLILEFDSKNHKKEIRTWKEIYNIEKRYKDELTNEGIGKYWLVQYLEEMTDEQRKVSLKKLPNLLTKSKFKGKNFLKVPFLQAWEEIGII